MPPTGIAQVLSGLPTQRDPNLLVGTETHDDAGVYRIAPDLALVQTIDFFPPVVDDPYTYGRIAAANALSDVYAMGGKPITALNMSCFPDDRIDLQVLRKIIEGGAERCVAAGCTILGGHTVRDSEIKFGLAVTGTVHPDRILTNAGAKPGDQLVLTKPLGTGFITTAAKMQRCPQSLYDAAVASMMELNRGACEAMLAVGVNAATDVTGFGLAGHALEMAEGSGTTLRLNLQALPLLIEPGLLDVTRYRTRASTTNREYTQHATKMEVPIDPYRLEFFYDAQTSGGLMISVAAERVPSLLDALKQANTLSSSVIGEVLPRQGSSSLILR